MADRDDKRPGGDSSGELDPDALPSEEEVLASSRLRDELARTEAGRRAGSSVGGPASGLPTGAGRPSSGESSRELDANVDLARSLRAAWVPASIDPEEHADLVGDVPTADELALATELREALDQDGMATLPDVVVGLRSAWSASELPEAEHRAIVARALGHARILPFRTRARTVRVIIVTTTTALAVAASVVVWMTAVPPTQEAPLARARSTQPLFGEPFKAGETSARIDKIALARASDYRDNRFAKWGVR
jgi:hypothetical protein